MGVVDSIQTGVGAEPSDLVCTFALVGRPAEPGDDGARVFEVSATGTAVETATDERRLGLP